MSRKRSKRSRSLSQRAMTPSTPDDARRLRHHHLHRHHNHLSLLTFFTLTFLLFSLSISVLADSSRPTASITISTSSSSLSSSSSSSSSLSPSSSSSPSSLPSSPSPSSISVSISATRASQEPSGTSQESSGTVLGSTSGSSSLSKRSLPHDGNPDSETPTHSFTVVTGPVPFSTTSGQSQNRAGDIRKLLEDYVAYIATMEHFDPESTSGSLSHSSSLLPLSNQPLGERSAPLSPLSVSLSPSSSLSSSLSPSSLSSPSSSSSLRAESVHSSESRDRFIFQAAPADHSSSPTAHLAESSSSPIVSLTKPLLKASLHLTPAVSGSGTFQEPSTESALTLNLSDEELTSFIDNVLGASIQSDKASTTTTTPTPSTSGSVLSTTEKTSFETVTDSPISLALSSDAQNGVGKIGRFERAELSGSSDVTANLTGNGNKNGTSPSSTANPEVELSEEKFYTHDYDYGPGENSSTGSLTSEELFKLTEIEKSQKTVPASGESKEKVEKANSTSGSADETFSNNFRSPLGSEDTELLRELRKAKLLLQAEMDRLRLTTTTARPLTTTTEPEVVTTTETIIQNEPEVTTMSSMGFTTLQPFTDNSNEVTEPTTVQTPFINSVTTTTSAPTTPEEPTTTATPTQSKRETEKSEIVSKPEVVIDTVNGTAETTILTHVPKITIIHKIKKPAGVRSRSDEDAIYREALRKHRELIRNTMSSISLVPAAFKRYKVTSDNNRVNSVGEIYLLPNFAQIQAQKAQAIHEVPKPQNLVQEPPRMVENHNFENLRQPEVESQTLHHLQGLFNPKNRIQNPESFQNPSEFHSSIIKMDQQQNRQVLNDIDRQLLGALEMAMKSSPNIHNSDSLTSSIFASTSGQSMAHSAPAPPPSPRLPVVPIGTTSGTPRCFVAARNRNSYKRLLNKFNNVNGGFSGFSGTGNGQGHVNNFNLINFNSVNNDLGNHLDNRQAESTVEEIRKIDETTDKKVVTNKKETGSVEDTPLRQYVNLINAFNLPDAHPEHVLALFRPRPRVTNGSGASRKFKRIRIVATPSSTGEVPAIMIRHHKRIVKVEKSLPLRMPEPEVSHKAAFGERTAKKVIEKVEEHKKIEDSKKEEIKKEEVKTTEKPEVKKEEITTTTTATPLDFSSPTTTSGPVVSTGSSTTTPIPHITTTEAPRSVPETSTEVPRVVPKKSAKITITTTTILPISKLNVTQVVENILVHNEDKNILLNSTENNSIKKNLTLSAAPEMEPRNVKNLTSGPVLPLKGFNIFCGYDASAMWNGTSGVTFGMEQLEQNPHVLATCSHLIYSFASINMNGELEIPGTAEELARLRRIRSSHAPQLKMLVAVGGADTPPQLYSLLVATSKLRERLAANIHKFILDHEMDGAVVAWFYPVFGSLTGSKSNNTSPSRNARSTSGAGQQLFQIDDQANLVKFVRALRIRFDSIPLKVRLEIGLFAPPFDDAIDKGYDLNKLNSFVDHSIVLTYDYFGSTSAAVHHFAPLYPDSANRKSERGQRLSINHTMNHWLSVSPPNMAKKTLLSLAFYGRTFTLENGDNFVPGSKALGPGKPGPISAQPGLVFFNELCDLYLGHASVRLIEDENKVTTFLKLADQWVGFDDELSLYRKTKYVINRGLSGVFVWDLGLDDFRNRCGWGKFPLLNAVRKAVEHCQSAIANGGQC